MLNGTEYTIDKNITRRITNEVHSGGASRSRNVIDVKITPKSLNLTPIINEAPKTTKHEKWVFVYDVWIPKSLIKNRTKLYYRPQIIRDNKSNHQKYRLGRERSLNSRQTSSKIQLEIQQNHENSETFSQHQFRPKLTERGLKNRINLKHNLKAIRNKERQDMLENRVSKVLRIKNYA